MTAARDFTPPALVPLSENHDVTKFDSGEPSLDSWLRDHALTLARRGLSATHVWADADDRVLGYSTLAAASIGRRELTKAMGHGFPDRIPAVLLARLALSKDLQGRKLGGVLLFEALQLARHSAGHVAAAFIVVDALHEKAANFYIHHGFRRMPETNRLALKMSTIAAAEAGPPDPAGGRS
jgi:GNAT superfamily N-acetyltransferase